jgi:hypothetical protein
MSAISLAGILILLQDLSWRCRVLLRRQPVLKPLSHISASRPVAPISLYRFFIFFHPDISPLISFILYILCSPVLCVPVRNVYRYILIYSFLFLVVYTSLRSTSRRFVSYPKYLAHSRASMYHSLDRLQEAQELEALLRD